MKEKTMNKFTVPLFYKFIFRTSCVVLLFICSSFGIVAAQSQVQVLNALNGLPVVNCEVIIENKVVAKSDEQGFVNIPLNTSDSVVFYAIGFHRKSLPQEALSSMKSVMLSPFNYHLRSVEVVDSFFEPLRVESGAIQIDAKALEKLPTFMAEPDLFKTIQLLPGVTSVMENNTGLFVRGGKASQTLTLLDDAPLYNTSHSAGLFSVVHPTAVESATLHKNGIPARFGTRASSVLDLRLKNGNREAWEGSVGLGLASAYIDVQGPLRKKANPSVTFQAIGRITYIDKLLEAIDPSIGFSTGFEDFTIKLNTKINNKNYLTTSFYTSNDHFRIDLGELLSFGNQAQWSNNVFSAQYTSVISDKWISKATVYYSQYQTSLQYGNLSTHSSGINDIGLKWRNDLAINTSSRLGFGINIAEHTINSGALELINESDNRLFNPFTLPITKALEYSSYVDYTKNFSKYDMYAGLRLVGFGRFVNLEPRLKLSRSFNGHLLSLSFDRITQYMHIYSANVTDLPNDIWYASNDEIPPVISNSLAFDYQFILNRKTTLNSSLYYRTFENATDFGGGTNTIPEPGYEQFIHIGQNTSYGFEFLVQRNAGWITGWIGYTFSRSINNIDGILSEGTKYPANHDRPHALNVVLNKKWNKWELNITFVMQSGRPVTLPEYVSGTRTHAIFSERNEHRMPVYHRADLAITKYLKVKKHHQSRINLSIYNVYNRRNIYAVFYDPIQYRVRAISAFPILPFLSYNIRFF